MPYDLTIGGVSCKELHNGSGVEQFDFTPENQGSGATRVFQCAFADRYTLISALRFTVHPTQSGSYAMTFESEPVGPPTGEDTWTDCKITVQYKSVPTKEIRIETTAENVSWDKAGTQFESGTTPSEQQNNVDPQVFLTMTRYEIIYHNQTALNETLWKTFVGCVNNASHQVEAVTGFATWDEGTLLYVGYDASQKITALGTWYEVSHKLLGCEIPHNQMFNVRTGDYDNIVAKATGNYRYTEKNFSTLGI